MAMMLTPISVDVVNAKSIVCIRVSLKLSRLSQKLVFCHSKPVENPLLKLPCLLASLVVFCVRTGTECLTIALAGMGQ